MISKARLLICLPVLLAILACSSYIPAIKREPLPPQENNQIARKPTVISHATNTPHPTAIPSQTVSLPSPTVNLISTLTPEPTLIPLDFQLRIFESWRCSSCPNAVSRNLACRCHAGSLVKGISGESADGAMPARKRAVSFAVTVSAARSGIAAARNMVAASAAIFTD